MARDRFADGDVRRDSGQDRDYDDDYTEYGRRRPLDDSAEYETYDSAYGEAYDDRYDVDETAASRALATHDGQRDLAPVDDASRQVAVVIPGTGVSMGEPFIKRRARPLTMRLMVLTVIATLLVTGLISVTPLGASAQPGVSSFEALAGAVVMTKTQQFIWYTAKWGDSLDSLAKRFGVQAGGIMQLNGLCPGQELQIGTQYKIPTSSSYGSNYKEEAAASGECNFLPVGGAWGKTVFGTNWWNARAGEPGPEAVCASSHGNVAPLLSGSEALKFKFAGPNPHSYWVRGFSWIHDGVDIAAPSGNPIHAAQSGQIIWAGYDGTNGFGWSVVINHCYHVSTLYGHMLGLAPGIRTGQNVDQNTVIGYEGSTGWSTGPHLHISVLVDNQTVDPMLFYSSIYAITH